MTKRPEKKSERFEVRLPYSKKNSFVKACEDQGDTPSHAVRRFIDSYIRRADADDAGALLRRMPQIIVRNWFQLLIWAIGIFAGAIVLFLCISIFITQMTLSNNDKLFAEFDKNGDGILMMGEISEYDYHLHRVLNVDGNKGISKEGFWAKGRMRWSYVNPETFIVTEQQDGIGKSYSQVRQSYGNADLEKYKPYIVEFDLTDISKPRFSVFKLGDTTLTSPQMTDNGSVKWVEGEDKPVHVMGTQREVFLTGKRK